MGFVHLYCDCGNEYKCVQYVSIKSNTIASGHQIYVNFKEGFGGEVELLGAGKLGRLGAPVLPPLDETLIKF